MSACPTLLDLRGGARRVAASHVPESVTPAPGRRPESKPVRWASLRRGCGRGASVAVGCGRRVRAGRTLRRKRGATGADRGRIAPIPPSSVVSRRYGAGRGIAGIDGPASLRAGLARANRDGPELTGYRRTTGRGRVGGCGYRADRRDVSPIAALRARRARVRRRASFARAHDGSPLPSWDGLGERQREAWKAAAARPVRGRRRHSRPPVTAATATDLHDAPGIRPDHRDTSTHRPSPGGSSPPVAHGAGFAADGTRAARTRGSPDPTPRPALVAGGAVTFGPASSRGAHRPAAAQWPGRAVTRGARRRPASRVPARGRVRVAARIGGAAGPIRAVDARGSPPVAHGAGFAADGTPAVRESGPRPDVDPAPASAAARAKARTRARSRR